MLHNIEVFPEEARRIKELAAKVALENEVDPLYAEAAVVSALFNAIDRDNVDIFRDFIWS